MEKKQFANFVVASLGLASMATINIEATSIDFHEIKTFNIESQPINLCVCDQEDLSVNDISKMIVCRNQRDRKLVKSSVDRNDHL